MGALLAAFNGAIAGVTEEPSLGESSIVIVSQADRPLSFNLRPRDGTWSNYTIASGTNMKISCNQCSTESFEVEVDTEGRKVDYFLPAGLRFSIQWNASKNLWDVFQVTQ
jgi:hypothetical protein